MPRFTLQDDDDDEPADSNSQGENEPPHPLGFATPPPGAISPGRSRYGLHLDEEDEAEDWLERKAIAPRTYPLLSSYLQTGVSTTPMKVLVRDAYLDAAQNQTADDDEQDDGLDGLTDVLQVIRLSKPSSGTPLALQQTAAAPQDLTYYKVDRYNEVCRGRIAEYAKKLEHGNQSLAHSLQKYIDKQRLEAERIREEQRRQQEEEEEAKREADRVAREEEEIQQKKDQAEADKKEAEVKAAKVKADAASSAKQKVKADQDAKEKAENEYIYKAEKLVSRLVELRANVETFEKSKPMSKRRLSMKKVVNGRVNTLSEDAGKIRLVAADVNAAVAQARQDDLQVKAQLEAGNPQYSAEMARGKRYFSDLLASKVIVRVQAEGFNGQRGDGFPLAHMLALVNAENKDLAPVMQAHVFTVCPTAVPNLPTPAPDASEDDLMKSLGMLKTKDGEYETFERFLSRTEGIISIMANIMSSQPPDHTLFEGSRGAIKWLRHFLSQLPRSPHSPLPLLTAPVLDAFLTGAGHMLANQYSDDFKKELAYIEKEVVSRLDEGSIGAPSALRLRKTIQGGFDGFKHNLPSRALGELYLGANGQAAGRGNSQSTASGGAVSQTSFSAASPFGNQPSTSGQAGSQSQANAMSAFNQTTNGSPASSSFGTSAPLHSPFSGQPSSAPFMAGGNAMSSMTAPVPSPFGTSAPGPSPFGSAPGSSPFGAPAAASAPFGSAPGSSLFGGNAPAPSPFGSATQAPGLSSPSPFGGPAQSSPFGGPAPGPAPYGAPPGGSPFGSQSNAPTPFSSTGPSNPSTFGASVTASSPFGATNTAGPSSFGSGAPPPFGGNAPAPAPFGSPFGGAAPGPSPFGGAAPAPSPFGSGGTTMGSPFGSTAAPSPFGSTAAPSSSSFGNFSSAPAQTPFSGNNQARGGGGGSSNKPPCRFFAKGQCRYGNKCNFSHDTQPSATSFSNPFGGPRR